MFLDRHGNLYAQPNMLLQGVCYCGRKVKGSYSNSFTPICIADIYGFISHLPASKTEMQL